MDHVLFNGTNAVRVPPTLCRSSGTPWEDFRVGP
jgi:hypothetical protein